jgi:hypothetical protein
MDMNTCVDTKHIVWCPRTALWASRQLAAHADFDRLARSNQSKIARDVIWLQISIV